jgi:putative transposase
MCKSKCSEEQIIAILAEQERGMATSEVCRHHSVSSAIFYKWKAKFAGMDVSDARRLKTLETENARLKKLLADSMLDVSIWKDLLVSGNARKTIRASISVPFMAKKHRTRGM